MYKVLIIEDDRTVSHIYEAKLKKEGYLVATALDGQAGLQKFHNFKPDIVLVDMALPKVSGQEIIKHIRSSHTTQNCAVIAFSGTREFLDEAENAGALIALSKEEFSPAQIVSRITEVLAAVSQKTSDNKRASGSALEGFAPHADRVSDPIPSKGRVLIVEDDPVTMVLVREIVKSEGYIPEMAKNGMDGYKTLINDKDFALAIFDIKMPELSGIDLLRLMRKDTRLENMPVMLMSSERVSHISFESLGTGVVVFVPKPFTRATLRAMFSVCFESYPKSANIS